MQNTTEVMDLHFIMDIINWAVEVGIWPHALPYHARGQPLPIPCLPLNFTNSTGLRYEAKEGRQCLIKGFEESPRMPLADSVLLTEIMDEIRKQVGVAFN
ncbi:hypothetical protein FQN60_011370 [Etheostoma spectabile]|uniref:Uncharacterized protein n=1 Tax=Etheostoma spectabile TaxID=54343 RepID=A0A5J5DRY1_9PERO|nr:hypothetical protein FQN60_011370 [Etheostoma spectabile]